jgi:hypothetical protein
VEFESGHRGHMKVSDQAGSSTRSGEARKSAADGKASTA